MKLYVASIAKKEVKSLVESNCWSIKDMISFFVYDNNTGKTIQVFGAGEYGSYGEEGTIVEIINAKTERRMFFGEIIEYAALSASAKGVKTFFLD